MQCLIWQLPRDIQRWALHEIRWNTWCRRICQRMLPWRLAAGACWRDIVWPNVTCRLSVRSFDRRDLVPTFEGALRDTETDRERWRKTENLAVPSDAMPCATQDLVQLATRCAATSLPWGFGIAKLCCDILVTVRAVQCKQVVCDDFVMIYVLIYLLINSLQRGRQT